jgi:hypothetical protein
MKRGSGIMTVHHGSRAEEQERESAVFSDATIAKIPDALARHVQHNKFWRDAPTHWHAARSESTCNIEIPSPLLDEAVAPA